MKTKFRFIGTWAMAGIFACSSCHHFAVSANKDNASGQKLVSYAVSGPGDVVLDKETTVFAPQIFLNGLNQPVTGTVHIKLLEICAKSKVTGLNNTVDSTGPHPIITDGEFYIRATASQNGMPLHILQDSQYQAIVQHDKGD